MIPKFRDKTDIFFDLDHTIWDFETNSALAFEHVFKLNKVPFTMDAFLQYYVPINEAYWHRYSLNQVTQAELRFGRLNDTFSCLAFDASPEYIQFISKAYIETLPNNNHLFAGAYELLDYLKPNYNLHILTNGFQEVQANKLRHAKLEGYFKTVTNSEQAGAKKPALEIFKYALKQANTQANRAVMIGDNLMADVHGALQSGMDAIHFCNTQPKMEPEVIQVQTLLEIKNYF